MNSNPLSGEMLKQARELADKIVIMVSQKDDKVATFAVLSVAFTLKREDPEFYQKCISKLTEIDLKLKDLERIFDA